MCSDDTFAQDVFFFAQDVLMSVISIGPTHFPGEVPYKDIGDGEVKFIHCKCHGY